MPRPIPVALIGQKFMGRAHSNAYGQVGRFFDVPSVPVQAVLCGRNAAELERFAERWGWARYTTDWRAAVTDPEVELVDIATPNFLHREPALAAFEAGKHVISEKPLAGTLEDARAMRDAAAAAREQGLHSFVWFNYRRCPAVALAHQLIRDGKLGRIYHVRAHYLQSWGGPQTPLSWRFQKDLAGSGAHGDLNAHSVDLARFLLGAEVEEVHGAVSRTFIDERPLVSGDPQGERGVSDVDDCVLFLASFAGGAVASFEASRVATGHLNDNSIEINGERGALRFGFEDMNELWYHDGAAEAGTEGWRRIVCTQAQHPYVGNWWPDAHILGYEHGFTNMLSDVMRVLGGEAPLVPLPDFEDAYQTQRVLDAALVAARERRAVALTEVDA